MDDINREKLADHNGKDGKKAYVAYEGKVYDITTSAKWKDGKHMMRHNAGEDLTGQISAAPHGTEVLEKFETVGTFVCAVPDKADEPKLFWPLSRLYTKYPIFKRHLHPMSVHYPIAFLMGSFLCCLIFLFFKHPALETTAFHLALLGTVTAPIALISGIQSWWLFYRLKKTKVILYKLFLAPLLVITAGTASIMHITNPGILVNGGIRAFIYLVLLGACVPIVATLGYFGGKMTFPE